ncbi:MAG: DUF4327 family protein [Cyanobacteria bacterium]|nr:DUF4327 family protein [Cyanobacteriota bacterium]
MAQVVAHPMEKLQRKVRQLVGSGLLAPTDGIWKIAFLYGTEWPHWKAELLDFGFEMQDPVSELLLVEAWEEED